MVFYAGERTPLQYPDSLEPWEVMQLMKDATLKSIVADVRNEQSVLSAARDEVERRLKTRREFERLWGAPLDHE